MKKKRGYKKAEKGESNKTGGKNRKEEIIKYINKGYLFFFPKVPRQFSLGTFSFPKKKSTRHLL